MLNSACSTAHSPVRVGIGWRHAHYRELLEHLPKLDFLEVHSENFFAMGGAGFQVLMRGCEHYPISLHGVGLSLGSAIGIDAWHLERLADLTARVEPVRVSDHASFARGIYHGEVVHASDLLPIPFNAEALDVMCNNVDQVQSRLKRQLLVENLSAYLDWKCPPEESVWHETEFLSLLTRRTGCALLVDVNNIYVNALNSRRSGNPNTPVVDPEVLCRQWIDSIDSLSVGEIHLAGHCHVQDVHGDIVIDDHGSRVCPAVWRLYAHAVAQFGPVPTLVEWDTDLPPIEVLLDEANSAREVSAQTQMAVTT